MLNRLTRGLVNEIDEYGIRGGAHRWLGLQYVNRRFSHNGESIFSREWDVCVILDACRRDELLRVSDEYSWLGEIGSFESLESCTWHWLPSTIQNSPPDLLSDTAYVTANPFSERFCDGEFAYLDEVWKYGWDGNHGTVPPRPVTDRAISAGREEDFDRLLVHYIQPHTPFIELDAFEGSKQNFSLEYDSLPDEWDQVTRGELDSQTAIRGYRQNLELVLDDVSLLLNNLDAEDVVVTADHGESFGEYGIYGHPPTPLDSLSIVPWAETTAVDSGEYEPKQYEQAVRKNTDVEGRLEALGYR